MNLISTTLYPLTRVSAAAGVALFVLFGCGGGARPESGEQRLGVSAWPAAQSPVPRAAAQEEKIDRLLARMTLEEKVGQVIQAEIQFITPEEVRDYHIGSVLNGGGSVPGRNPRAPVADWLALGDAYYEASMDTSDGGVAIPVIWGTDAVHGHNNVYGATLFPHNIGLGATGNPELVKKIGAATAREVRASGIEWTFAPTLAVTQNDHWGRAYESYGEQPGIVKRLGAAMLEGLQGEAGSEAFLAADKVVATAKHFLADGGTRDGDDQGNATIGERELIDIHSPGYVAAIETGAQTVMVSFSSWNGTKMHANRYLLTDVLKGRMGFDGFVVGDWNGHGQVPGCTNESCPAAINAGIDLVMVPADWKKLYRNTLNQARAGEIAPARLDDAVRRLLRVKLRAGLFDARPSARAGARPGVIGSEEHRAIARQAVRESLVLLKDNDRLLPLDPRGHILVAGNGADSIARQSGGWSITWQGAGVANETFSGATSIFEGIRRAVEPHGGRATLYTGELYVPGALGEAPAAMENKPAAMENKSAMMEEEMEAKPDVAVVVFGESPYAEGQGDLNTLELEPGTKKSLALLRSLRASGIPTVSVFLSGRPLWVNPEINASEAFVAAWLPGSEGAGVADVIIAGGDGAARHDFKGKLTFSWPRRPTQALLNPHHPDYEPLFAYGHGLSYRGLALGDQQPGPGRLEEDLPGVASGAAQNIALYGGRPLEPWNIIIRSRDKSQILSGAYAALPEGVAMATTSDMKVQEDALTFRWNSEESGGIFLEGGELQSIDLSRHLDARALIALDMKVDSIPDGSVDFVIGCGDGCKRQVALNNHLRALVGKGWRRTSIRLSCFAREDDTFDRVTVPFGLGVEGRGELSFANVGIVMSGSETLACP